MNKQKNDVSMNKFTLSGDIISEMVIPHPYPNQGYSGKCVKVTKFKKPIQCTKDSIIYYSK